MGGPLGTAEKCLKLLLFATDQKEFARVPGRIFFASGGGLGLRTLRTLWNGPRTHYTYWSLLHVAGTFWYDVVALPFRLKLKLSSLRTPILLLLCLVL